MLSTPTFTLIDQPPTRTPTTYRSLCYLILFVHSHAQNQTGIDLIVV
jgi:hypothetical protein